jgi:rhodanese-related sulfurtransferase
VKIVVLLSALMLMACGKRATTPEAELVETTRKISAEFPQVSRITTAELAALLGDSTREPPLLLDVREPEEYAVSHLPGARRVDPDADTEKLLASLSPGRSVVLYCSVGYRSSKMAARFLTAGASDVRNLEGSIFQWANEGRLLYRDFKPVRQVHPYSSRYAGMLHPNLRSTL